MFLHGIEPGASIMGKSGPVYGLDFEQIADLCVFSGFWGFFEGFYFF